MMRTFFVCVVFYACTAASTLGQDWGWKEIDRSQIVPAIGAARVDIGKEAKGRQKPAYRKFPPADLLLVTTTFIRIEEDPELDETVALYQSVLRETEGLVAAYIELDSEECRSLYGTRVLNPDSAEQIKAVLGDIIEKTGASYVMIMGSECVVPRPEMEVPYEGGTVSVPSDLYYIDRDDDLIVDEGLSISRLPDLFNGSTAIVSALQTAIELHRAGGFTCSDKVYFMGDDHPTPPYGVCAACTMRDEFFELMSSSDFIYFGGHGDPYGFYSNERETIFTIDYMDDVDLRSRHPVILGFSSCETAVSYFYQPTLSYEFMRAGAAAFIGRTGRFGTTVGNFLDYLESGDRIGDALSRGIRETVLRDPEIHTAGGIQTHLYGDPTLRRRMVNSSPSLADLSCRIIDRGDGDGRIEPGEAFELYVTLVPRVDLRGCWLIRCEPMDPIVETVSGFVYAAASSGSVFGMRTLRRGITYEYQQPFEFRCGEYLEGEAYFDFELKMIDPRGGRQVIAQGRISLNEEGYLWAKDTSDSGVLVKLTSLLDEKETLSLPREVEEMIKPGGIGENVLYDEGRDCFWFAGGWIDAGSDYILRVPRERPEDYEMIPIAPYPGFSRQDRIAEMIQNPFDGALWLRTQDGFVYRFNESDDGRVEWMPLKVLPVLNLSRDDWGGARDIAIDEDWGKVWLTDGSRLVRFSASGGETELSVGGFADGETIAAGDCGCWISSKSDLYAISSEGEILEKVRGTFTRAEEMMVHPFDGSLWVLTEFPLWGSPHRLSLFSYTGEPLREWNLEAVSKDLIPSVRDGSVFTNTAGCVLRFMPDGRYGSPLASAPGYEAFAYQPFLERNSVTSVKEGSRWADKE